LFLVKLAIHSAVRLVRGISGHREILDLLLSRRDKDPLDFLSEVISTANGQYPAELKVQASNILAPHLHSKVGSTPSPRFIPDKISVPTFHSITEAEDYLASLPVLLGNGELDSPSALELSRLVKNWIGAKLERIDLISTIGGKPASNATHRLRTPEPAQL
jgi:hypothetical protein